MHTQLFTSGVVYKHIAFAESDQLHIDTISVCAYTDFPFGIAFEYLLYLSERIGGQPAAMVLFSIPTAYVFCRYNSNKSFNEV